MHVVGPSKCRRPLDATSLASPGGGGGGLEGGGGGLEGGGGCAK